MADIPTGVASGVASVVSVYDAPMWSDPQIWIIAGIVLVLITAIGIFIKFRE